MATRSSRRSTGTKRSGGRAVPGTATVRDTRTTIPKGSATRGFKPPGAKSASGPAIAGTPKVVVGKEASPGSPQPTRKMDSK